MPSYFLKYNTMLVHLQTRSQGLISSLKDDIYILVSPKSLYPEVHINNENLSNKMLPPWLEINTFYKITGGKEKKK